MTALLQDSAVFLGITGMTTLRKFSVPQSLIMRIRTQLLSVVINAQVRIRQHVHRGHYIEGHIVSIVLLLDEVLIYFISDYNEE